MQEASRRTRKAKKRHGRIALHCIHIVFYCRGFGFGLRDLRTTIVLLTWLVSSVVFLLGKFQPWSTITRYKSLPYDTFLLPIPSLSHIYLCIKEGKAEWYFYNAGGGVCVGGGGGMTLGMTFLQNHKSSWRHLGLALVDKKNIHQYSPTTFWRSLAAMSFR